MGVKERKEREKELRRGEILNRGEKLFVEKGFLSTTMDEIAGACELAKGTLYLHFKSKEELLSAILYRNLTVLYDMITTSLVGTDNPIEQLQILGRIHIEFYEKHPEYFRLISEIHMPGKFQPDINDNTHSLLVERIKSIWAINMSIIQSGKDSGIFKESADPLEVALSLWAISTAMIRVIDFRNHVIKTGSPQNMPLPDYDFQNIIAINAKRIIYSILKNPVADFDFVK